MLNFIDIFVRRIIFERTHDKTKNKQQYPDISVQFRKCDPSITEVKNRNQLPGTFLSFRMDNEGI